MTTEQKQKQYTRFSASQRLEHFALIVSMVGLALTGLPQRYAEYEFAKTMISMMGGIEGVRVIHRFMATILALASIYHGAAISYKIFVLGERITMMPSLRDVWDVRDYVLFNLGLKKKHPHMPRYNFGEKAEYLAVVWGTLLMGLTGFMMWNPIATAKILPGDTIPAALAAHSAEAILAVLSILIWHMYNVHFRRFNRSMFTGKINYDAMKEEHAEELEMIERGEGKVILPPGVIAQRKRRFWPYAIVMTIIMMIGMYIFVAYEETSIETVPRQDVIVFSPEVVPESGDVDVGATLWPTLRCARCHGDDATGRSDAPALVQTALPFDEFLQTVRAGKGDMPEIGVGEISDAYLLHVWTWLQTPLNP